jgi:hypothetical protein
MAFDLYITNQRIHWIWSNFQEVFCIYESPEDGHRLGPKHVVEVIHIKPQILLRTEVYKKVFDWYTRNSLHNPKVNLQGWRINQATGDMFLQNNGRVSTTTQRCIADDRTAVG